jgi:leader peptidase (prepilin peptidase)/N-methyltransferase
MTGLLATTPLELEFWANPSPPWVGVAAVFVAGAILGSFLNVCIHRLPLEKSILWPGSSHCGHCWQPIHFYDNIPLVSYWWLGGRCRTCGAAFSIRYFLIELLTAVSLAGLYYLEVIQNLHHLDREVLGAGRFAAGRVAIFGFHGVLVCFLIIATFADFDLQIIPAPLTVTGTLVGVTGSLLWPWPWPYNSHEVVGGLSVGAGDWGLPWNSAFFQLREGLYPWPVWGPLPAVLGPGGTWRAGLATSVAGLLVGSLIMRAVRFCFGIGMGSEYMEAANPEAGAGWFGRRWLSWVGRVGGKALGLGDADLMMMAGSFVGWQVIVVALFVGVVPGLVMGLVHLLLRGHKPFPFGPGLALGVMITMLGWPWIAPRLQPIFFDRTLMLGFAGVYGLSMLLGGYAIRLSRLIRH